MKFLHLSFLHSSGLCEWTKEIQHSVAVFMQKPQNKVQNSFKKYNKYTISYF